MSVGPLSVSAPLSILKRQHESAEYRGETSVSTFHIFINRTERPADLFYFYEAASSSSGEGEHGSGGGSRGKTKMVKHGTIQSGGNLYIGKSMLVGYLCSMTEPHGLPSMPPFYYLWHASCDE